jgi:hypothetical protein
MSAKKEQRPRIYESKNFITTGHELRLRCGYLLYNGGPPTAGSSI